MKMRAEQRRRHQARPHQRQHHAPEHAGSGVQPSISAASSISRGISSKKPIRIHTTSGSEKAT